MDSETASQTAVNAEQSAALDPLELWQDYREASGKWPADVAACAQKQYSHWEIVKNDDSGTNEQPMTIQTRWASSNPENWNAQFVNRCLQAAQVPREYVPNEIKPETCTNELQTRNLFRNRGEYVPKMGDLVALDFDRNGVADHVAILDATDGSSISVFLGNEEAYAKKETYDLADERIVGYGSLNDAYEEALADDSEVDGVSSLTASTGTKGAVNSTLEDRYTYIIYGWYEGQYYAVSETGETVAVRLEGNEIVSDSDAVKWTYDAEKKAFYNRAGEYLATTGWYMPLTVSSKPHEFLVKNPSGGEIETVLPPEQGGDQCCLTIFERKIVTGYYTSPGLGFARTEDEKKPEQGQETPIQPEPPAPQNTLGIQKYVEKRNQKDQYNLNLTVDGAYTQEGKNKADILYVVDTTGSMMYSMDGTVRDNMERWNSILTSVDYMTNLLESNSTADINYSMVFFSGSEGSANDAEVAQGWTADPNEIMKTLRKKGDWLGGGTNYEAACMELVDGPLVKQMRKDAERIVVFLSDGEANMYYGEYGTTVNDTSYDRRESITRAKVMLSLLTGIDMFYCVGVGSDVIEKGSLEELSSVLNGNNIETGYAHCNNTQEIEKAFDGIVHSIIQIKYNHIQVVDDLSQYAEIVPDTMLRLSVTNGQGQPVGVSEGALDTGTTLRLPPTQLNGETDLQLNYDPQLRRLVLTFPGTYILEDGWNYRMTATIQPTPIAYQEHAETQAYPNVGEPNTGETSSGRPGFDSNISAQLSYTLNEEKTSTMEYPKPVIQVSDRPGSRLPDTGGAGVVPVYAVGAMLIVLFVCMEYADKKQINFKNKKGETK